MFITVNELKTSVLNANLDVEYIQPAINEAEDVYLREILGDALYNNLVNKINGNTLTGKYQTLVNSYIKPYLTYKVQSILVVPINYKMRNAGVINQYDTGFSTTTVKDTAYLAEHYDSRAEFYANRLITYLKQNAVDFPEYGYSSSNVTNPTDSQNVTTIYLGGARKKCNCNITTGGGGGGTVDTVDWDNITNRPNFAEVATSGDYTDLLNTPNLAAVATSGDYTDLSNTPDLSDYVDTATYNQQMQNIDNALGDKVETAALCTINNERLDTRGNFELVKVEDIATVATTGDYEDLLNLPTIPAAQVQADWQQNDSSAVDYIKNKPSLPSAQIQADWNQTNTSEVDYIKNKPTIPAAQVNADWNANSGVSQILNKPSLATVATTGNYSDLNGTPSIPAAPVQSDWNETNTSSLAYIANKPSIPAAQVNSDWNAASGVAQILNKPSLATVATTGNYSDLNGTPTIPAAPVQSDWNESNTSSLAYIANKPTIPSAQVNSDWTSNSGVSQILNKPSFATVATSGDYNDLLNKPTIPAAQVQSDWNAVSGMGEILNKPSMTAETWTFTLSDNTTVTKTVWLQ